MAASKGVSPPSAPIPPNAPACAPLLVPLPDLIETDIDVPVPAIVDPTGGGMESFYRKAATLIRGSASGHVRIAVYGDSNLTRDFITGELRRTLQLRYGDAGHGFIALAKPWSWYLHMNVRHGFDEHAWRVIAMSTHPIPDRLYGFGGIAAQSTSPNARTWVATASEGSPIGLSVSRFDIYYLRRPGNGFFDVLIDGDAVASIDTGAADVEAGFQAFDVPDGPHRVDLVAGSKPVRLLGLVMERERPGFVVDAIGIGGVNVQTLVRGDRTLALTTLRHRSYDLVIFLTGATEPAVPSTEVALRDLVSLHREALPGVSILILSPPDLAGGASAKPTLNPRIGQLERLKRNVSASIGAAFWDFRAAMGGEMSIVRFAERRMAWTDYIHLTELGGTYMGRRLAYALLSGLSDYVRVHPAAGCDTQP